nr:putative reverse transcriptase domain-containing protein [Tanacetum cinerariifolium]
MLKVSPRKGVIRLGKQGKLNPRYIGPFKILERISPAAYELELPEELSNVHSTFHVSNLKKCLSDESLVIPMKKLWLDDKLNFVEAPMEVMDREVKQLKQSRIPIVKDDTHKQALGYQNPFHLKKAQQIQPSLYDGSVIAKEHYLIFVTDDEETFILEEESRSKMLDKQNDPILIEKKIKISPIDYSKLNKIKEYFDLNAQLQEKVFAITTLKNELRKLEGKNVVNTLVSKPNATIAPGMFKLDIEPISHRLKNNKDAHEVYIEKTIENTNTLRGFVERARTQNPSELLLESSCMFKKYVQLLLVYVSQTCPNLPKPSEKVKPTTSASGSKPSSNTKNNMITRPPSSNQKNKIKDHSRKVKSSLNKRNFVSEPVIIAPKPAVSIGTPSSTTIDQDAPLTSTSETPPETLSPVIPLGVEEANHDIEVAHIDNNPFVEFLIPEPSSEESSTQVVIPKHVHSINQPPGHLNKWTKDHPIDNAIGDHSRLVSSRQKLQDEALFYYFNAFISFVEPKRLCNSYYLQVDLQADTSMVEKSILDEDPQGKSVDHTRYRGGIGTLMYLTACWD